MIGLIIMFLFLIIAAIFVKIFGIALNWNQGKIYNVGFLICVMVIGLAYTIIMALIFKQILS